MKKLSIFMVSVMMFFAFGALMACGGENENPETNLSGTYKFTMTAEEMTISNTEHYGYLSYDKTITLLQENTLVLKNDKTYEYTKRVFFQEGSEIQLIYKFTGNYTFEENKVTLNAPVDCDFSENWANLADSGHFTNSSGKASNGGIVNCQSAKSHNPLHFFLTQFYKDSKETGENVVVIIDDSDNTFTYETVEAAE